MELETNAFRAYSSAATQFDFGNCSTEYRADQQQQQQHSGTPSGTRLFQIGSIWTGESGSASPSSASLPDTPPSAGLAAGKIMDSGSKDNSTSSTPLSLDNHNEEKPSSLGLISATTGRESSSPLSGSTGGTTSGSSVSSSLETSALELNSSIFGDSVWSSKGSFTDLGSFGSTEEERRFLDPNKSYLKPPSSAAASSNSAWGSFWSDLSPSLSPTNSETNLQHFGSHLATWNSASATTTANRRALPSNSSPFSSGSVSPVGIGRKQLSPSMASGSAVAGNLGTGGLNTHHQSTISPANYRQQSGFPNSINQTYRHYRRTVSYPANCQPAYASHHHMMNPYSMDANNYYPTLNDINCGWNMEPMNGGFSQDSRQLQQQHYSPSGMNSNGLDTMKQSFEPHLMEMMRTNGWDDSAKGRQFFGSYPSHDGSRFSEFFDPFDQMVPSSLSPLASRLSPRHLSSSTEYAGGERMHLYSRKVFVGGLPPDIDEEEITASFRRFGPLIVDWPHKAESKSYFPPKGYAFLLFQDEASVQALLEASFDEGDKTYFYVSSPTNKDKAVQIRPWRLTDNECYLDTQTKLDPRLTVFVGGVPRPLRAHELAMLMNQRFGYVAYAGIDVDSELKYPKGAGRITFSNQQSYIAAINARFVQLQSGEIDKRVELKPYVLDDQVCDFCHGIKCSGRMAPLFCSQVGCLAYLCEHCWTPYHVAAGKEHHKPVTKESSVDRSRPAAMRW